MWHGGILISPDKSESVDRLAVYLEQVRCSIEDSSPQSGEENSEVYRIGLNSAIKNTFIATYNDVKTLHHQRAFLVV